MSLKTFIARILADYRVGQIKKVVANPIETQEKLLKQLIYQAQNTIFGKEHCFSNIHTVKDYQQRTPIRDYEAFRGYIDRIYCGEKDVMWPGLPIYFAKTSGTTSGAKYIPITSDSMPNQVQGAKDALFFYIHETRNSSFLDGKMIFLTGSPVLETNAAGIKIGRLSGISTHFVPSYLQTNRVPTFNTNCIDDWEQKIDKIVDETMNSDLRLVSGIPPWVQMFFEKLKEKTGQYPAERWKNLSVFVQGGVDYSPYREIFNQSLGKNVDVVEVFPASEGFFAVQNSLKEEGLLLMLDYGIFYEFIPLEEYGQTNFRRLTLSEVELNKNYAMIITTNAGLWAYDLGDSIKFTSLYPFKIKVTGRVKQFISAFGEHVIEEEINSALEETLKVCPAQVTEFTVAPFISKEKSYHEWFIEFLTPPKELDKFIELLDNNIRIKNIYYNDLRNGEILESLNIVQLKQNACRDYMKSIGKLGGQNKFVRLKNNREIAEALSMYLV